MLRHGFVCCRNPHLIANRLHQQGGDALLAQDLKHAAMNRVFGFEIMPAPFVIAHWQIGLRLADAGAPLGAGTERALRRETSAADSDFVLFLLQSEPHAFIAGQGCAAATNGPAMWDHHCHANSVRPTSSIRADMIFGRTGA